MKTTKYLLALMFLLLCGTASAAPVIPLVAAYFISSPAIAFAVSVAAAAVGVACVRRRAKR